MIQGDEKTCSVCKETKSINDFYLKQKNPPIIRSECKKCKNSNDWKGKLKRRGYPPTKSMTKYPEHLSRQEKNKIYAENNKEKIKKKQIEFREKNRDKLKEYARNYRVENGDLAKESSKKSKEKNKDKIRETRKKYQKRKVENDPSFKIRRIISREISRNLKKNNESFLKYLTYSIRELRLHLESLFEPWMNWKNWGSYDPKTWDDGDSSTWKWNIDHIIPQSDLLYSSYSDENFHKCWSLKNLRPYSAKQNIKDGSSKIRHKKGKINE